MGTGLKGWLDRLLHTGEPAAVDERSGAVIGAEVRAYVQYHRLDAWWTTDFTTDERRLIEQRYEAIGRQPGHMLSSELTNSGQSPFGFLRGLMLCLDPIRHRDLIHRVFDKAVTLSGRQVRVSDQHFLYDAYLEMMTRDGCPHEADDARLDAACGAMIALAPAAAEAFRNQRSLPGHRGFELLGHRLEVRGDWAGAGELYRQAKAQGWAGRWEVGIVRCGRASG